MPTKPTQMRLTEDDRDKIEAIRGYFGLASGSQAVRYAVHATWHTIPDLKKTSKKSKKKA